MYYLFKPILFLFDPELIHRLTLFSLKLFPFRKKNIDKAIKKLKIMVEAVKNF